MQEGLVSVIMPTYNASQFLEASIESVLNQTYTNLELLITDDHSSDPETIEILKRYSLTDTRVRVFYFKENQGAGPARNNSIREAKGQYIAFCDSDDCWMPEKLEMQLRFMREYNTPVTYAAYIMWDEHNREKGIFIPPRRITYYGMLRDDKMGFSTCIYNVGMTGKKFYMPNLRKRQDWAMLIELMQHCRVAYGTKEPLMHYRVRANSISSNKIELIKYNAKVYQEILHFSKLQSYLYFALLFLPTYSLKMIKKKFDSWNYLQKRKYCAQHNN